MSFHEKSAAVMLAVLGLVFGGYGIQVIETLIAGGGDIAAAAPTLIGLIIGVIVLSIIGHILIAIFIQKGDDSEDERDRFVRLLASRNSGFVLGVGVLGVLTLTLMQSSLYVIAHGILAAMVIAEMVNFASQLVYYRKAY